MLVSFKTRKIEKTMADAKAIGRYYGDNAKRLMTRLSVLYQAKCLADVPTGPPDCCHQLAGDFPGHFAVQVSGNDRLVFAPNHEPVPLKEDGGIDLTAITSIVIVAVRDYH
jgi:plasmid maintenance system killer protein